MNDWVHSFRMPPIAEKKSVIFDKDEDEIKPVVHFSFDQDCFLLGPEIGFQLASVRQRDISTQKSCVCGRR
jgi:dihydrodipicolinate reductase